MIIGRRQRWEVVSILLMSASCAVLAADRLRPPGEVFRDPVNLALEATVVGGGRQSLELGRVQLLIAGSPEEELRLKRLMQANGAVGHDNRATVVVRRDGESPLVVRPGARVIVAVTELVSGRFPQPKLSLDAGGLRVVSLPAVGEALFPYSTDLAAVLSWTPAAMPDAASAFPDLLVKLLDDPDASTRRCAAVELFADPELIQRMTPEKLGQLRERITDEREDSVVREFLLHAAVKNGESQTARWVVAAAREVLADAPLQIDLDSAVPALQDAALEVLAIGGCVDDVAVVARLLSSSSPGVAMSAAECLQALDPAAARREVERALGEAGLSEQSVRNLRAFLRRVGDAADR